MKGIDNAWLKEKVTITLTRNEMLELANVFHAADFSESDFLVCKKKKIRDMFKEEHDKRHKLWLKIIKVADGR